LGWIQGGGWMTQNNVLLSYTNFGVLVKGITPTMYLPRVRKKKAFLILIYQIAFDGQG